MTARRSPALRRVLVCVAASLALSGAVSSVSAATAATVAGASAPAAPMVDHSGSSGQTGLELSVPVSQALQRLQEQWLQWMSALYQGNQPRADSALTSILGAGQQLGMKRLPDLSLAAGARARSRRPARARRLCASGA